MRVSTITVTGVGQSPWLPIDHLSDGYGDGLYLKPGAGATCSVEVTPDDIQNPLVTPTAFPCNIAALTGATGNASGGLTQAAKAVRINQTVGASVSTLVVVVRGLG